LPIWFQLAKVKFTTPRSARSGFARKNPGTPASPFGLALAGTIIDGAQYRTLTELVVTVLRGKGMPAGFAALVVGSAIVVSGPGVRAASDPQEAHAS
jgi:hypothetical protein